MQKSPAPLKTFRGRCGALLSLTGPNLSRYQSLCPLIKFANIGMCRSLSVCTKKPLGALLSCCAAPVGQLCYQIKVFMSLNLRGKSGESVNILKSSKQCQKMNIGARHLRWPTSCWGKTLLKILSLKLTETIGSLGSLIRAWALWTQQEVDHLEWRAPIFILLTLFRGFLYLKDSFYVASSFEIWRGSTSFTGSHL